MKHRLARIRQEAAVAYALAHPEVKLSDIGAALGVKGSHACATVGAWLGEAGHSRPKGFGSPAFDKSVVKPRLLAKHRAEVRTMLEAGASHPEVAERFGVHKDTAGEFAREVLGIGKLKKRP